ncbi:bis(5'-nucleosyl)-tetraphosphatase (symmetrical) YqeK [Solibaculum mannosilyticum]|uniref:bis(5'-nucleosyl)-tetraphosphatase (symmetrical) YqeK n=1 Tax=Solibaculum mannosilyticum TaxID=2780922 RepID=UPI0034BF2D1E
MDRYEEYKKLLKTMMSEYRYRHSLGVADEARKLAERYGADVEKATVAGLLHDIMKDQPPKVQLQTIEDSGIILTPVERASQKLWHAIAGAGYVRMKLGIRDPEIFDAILYHTTGRDGMSRLAKVLYVADYTSCDRQYEGVEHMRELAKVSLEDAMREGLRFTIQELSGLERTIHPNTIFAYNELVCDKLRQQRDSAV